ncbi:MAG: hypothetical protein PHC28_15205 [Flavobacterium sp.]|uniref:hypothetical protein n=1 Tax=Flavobacterium sp. TaxID=239 RepID=UPI00260542FB|nr:hypothetical protein [Flavobacterium sp.]MDD5151802.1 hypothetical protein [Flavobacterium sp.]
MKYIGQELKNRIIAAGMENNVELLSILITGNRLEGKLVREANEIFRASIPVFKETKTIVGHDTKSIMIRAWEIAKYGAKMYGGNVKSYFNASLRIAWLEVKFN